MVSSDSWLVISIWFGSFCPQRRLQLGPAVTHYQFVQSGLICCFHQAAAALPYHLLLALPLLPDSWLLWKVGLSPLTPTLSLCSSPCLHLLRVWFLASPLFSKVSSVFHPIHTTSGALQFTVYVQRGCSLLRGCAGVCSLGVDRGVMWGVWYSPVESADLHRQLWNWLKGRSDMPLFSRHLLELVQPGMV
jgi:hypothetical protein